MPQITPAHLRRADDMCRRRLAREVNGGKRRANRTGDMRFAVSNRVEADARLAQTEFGVPRLEAFVEPHELEPEQRALYRAAKYGYVEMFGDDPARIVELPFRTEMPDSGVELSSNIGLAAEMAGDRRQLRKLVVGAPRSSRLFDDIDLRVALVRTEEWAPDRLEIVAVDVIEQRRVPVKVADLGAARAEARDWIAARVVRVLELASDPRPRAGRDCQGCAFISGCSVHSG